MKYMGVNELREKFRAHKEELRAKVAKANAKIHEA